MTIEFGTQFRVSTDEKGFISLRTGETDAAADSDLIASVWNDDFLSLLLSAPALLELAYQYRNDLLYPPSSDSRERRISAIDAAISKATGSPQ